MREDRLAKQLKDAIARRGETPPKERFEDLVRRGVIDSEGRVLLRREPPSNHREPPTGPKG